MGLAAWGKPRYHDEALVGNWFELPEKVRSEAGTLARDVDFGKSVFEYWRQRRGLEFSPGAALRTAQVPPDHAADIAASAQMTFERTMLKTAEAAQGIAQRAGFDYDAIVLAGGCALNCPANSLIHRRLGKRVFVPPAVNDEGNSAGAALALHGLLGNESAPRARRSAGQIAYKGRPYAAKRAEIEPFLAQVGVVKTDAPAVYLAQRILRGAVAGIFEAGAEIGPRALGHRSLVASPQIADNWRKLNAIKGREQWRPLAPVVLPEDAGKYFEGFPEDSHYMLFNARVTADSLPAVTHRDGTARVQIAHPDNGFLFELLRAFKAISGCGVLINTSFNGPDEPIVETPGDALRSFVKLGFAFLYLDGIVVARRRAGATGAPDRPAAPSSG
jgi:carbamoyltransferase